MDRDGRLLMVALCVTLAVMAVFPRGVLGATTINWLIPEPEALRLGLNSEYDHTHTIQSLCTKRCLNHQNHHFSSDSRLVVLEV